MATEPRFLAVEQALKLHERTLMAHGGLAGIRGLGLLEAAMAMPRQKCGGVFLHEGLAAMAAAYLYHVAANHAFADGNKRVAATCCLVFLKVNGIDTLPTPDDLEKMTLAVADGQLSKAQLTRWFNEHTGEGT